MQRELTLLLQEYSRGELEIARQLDAQLEPDQQQALMKSLADAMERAPTRPHPYTPHTRGLARLMFRIDSLWDRAFDAMDNRTVPSRRAPVPNQPPGIWDRYFMGRPHFEQPRERRNARR
jgi:hypothetical protein